MGNVTNLVKTAKGWLPLEGVESSDGKNAGLVVAKNDGTAGQAHNRFITGIAKTRATLGHMTWDVDEKVDTFQIKLVPKTGSPTAGDIVRFVIDAMPVYDTTDDSQAWNWLQTPTAAEDTDVMFDEVIYVPTANLASGEDAWSKPFAMGSYVRRLDFHYPNGTAGTTDFDIYVRKI